jgi:hypothetical protein
VETVLQAAVLTAVVALIVWLKVVRPVRGDLAWKRQGERLARAKAARLARHRAGAVRS